MFQTKSNFSYINTAKNADKTNSNKTCSNFYSAANLNNKNFRGCSASNCLKFKTTPFSFTNQSPKISSGKIRNGFQVQKPLFSLIDINDKKTHSKGTTIPMQFIRRTNDEIIKILNIKIKPPKLNKEGEQQHKMMIKAQITTSLSSNIEKNHNENQNAGTNTIDIDQQIQQLPNKQLNPLSSIMNENQRDNGYEIEKQKEQENTIKEKSICYQNHESLIKPKTAIPNQRLNIVSIDNPICHTRNDKWKPDSYSTYELLVKNPELMKQEVLLNSFARKLPNISIKDIRDRSRKSDIFFTQPKEGNYYEKVQCYTDFQNSDVFLLKNDKFSQSKSGERNMIIKDSRIETYTVSKKSNSEWHAKNSMPTLLNHNSAEWNLTNPDRRNIGKTQKEISRECKEKDEKFNPIYRQKSLCEFIDLTRNGAPNPNRSYLNCLNKTVTCFNRRSDVCSTYNDIFGTYKDLCDKPFSKPKLI